jgi:hypothetical protein
MCLLPRATLHSDSEQIEPKHPNLKTQQGMVKTTQAYTVSQKASGRISPITQKHK